MKIRTYTGRVILYLIAACALTGCKTGNSEERIPEAPAAVTVWHSYNALAKIKFDQLVMNFNETVGMEKGIVVDSQGYGSSEELSDALYDSANEMTGSDALPNIFISYPDSAYRLNEIAPLVKMETYFTEEELAAYRKEFLEEGIWDGTDSYRMIPIAKSTELLYLNRTDWDRFAEETGASMELLRTWEGLSKAASMYYDWSQGKAFLGINSYNDFAVLSAAQAGEEPYDEKGGFHYSRETAKRAWDAYYVPHIQGWYRSSVYNQDGIKSGNLIAYIGSSAGASFFPEEVIVNDHETYPVECEVLPYPVFKDGGNYMTQRGANLAVFESDPVHEAAAVEFLKWITAPEQNVKFAVSTGYLPVQNKALDSAELVVEYVEEENNPEAVKLGMKAAIKAMESGIFYSRKPFKGSYERNAVFSESLADRTSRDIMELEASGADYDDKLHKFLSEENFEAWYQSLLIEMDGGANEQKD
ncbi:extracellular solute-binding protein [Clostridium sp. AM58-1XD]|uniref:extracellular solute-binding protein n=1 Tax=Clostridium sp. AM58-1XD TaxID=2292307 RepID=UPI000E4CC39D|nr:extracellular solute-binding protein [Clostridium sp. AM58-1XD]RGY96659.1 extracellular solute-binding protein [Clostridium sp. AM58-1XD]